MLKQGLKALDNRDRRLVIASSLHSCYQFIFL